jgi:hypothetical protein
MPLQNGPCAWNVQQLLLKSNTVRIFENGGQMFFTDSVTPPTSLNTLTGGTIQSTTLDQAYDNFGGGGPAGGGRTITADAGAVRINKPSADANNAFEVNVSAGTGAAAQIRGFTEWTSPFAAPAISNPGTARVFCDGAFLQLSVNGSAYTPISTGAGGSLGDAYNTAPVSIPTTGAGRVIDANAGAVRINKSSADTNNAFEVNVSAGTGAAVQVRGFTEWTVPFAAPAVAPAGAARVFCDGVSLQLSVNGGAYATIGGGGSLGDAYNTTSTGVPLSGNGRIITANAGAVRINKSSVDANNAFEVNVSNGTGAAIQVSGFTEWKSFATPAVAPAGAARVFCDGVSLQLSVNGGAYAPVGGGGGGSLGDAYNTTSTGVPLSGNGRIITANAGAVRINKSSADTNNAFEVNVTGGSGLSALFTGASIACDGSGGLTSLRFGRGANAFGGSSLALGTTAVANIDFSIAIGTNATTNSASSIAIGYGATVNSSSDFSIALGRGAFAAGSNKFVIGSASAPITSMIFNDITSSAIDVVISSSSTNSGRGSDIGIVPGHGAGGNRNGWVILGGLGPARSGVDVVESFGLGSIKSVSDAQFPYTQTETDVTIICNATGTGRVLNLLSTTNRQGRFLCITKPPGTGTSVVITPAAGDTIDGAATLTLASSSPNQSVIILADDVNNNWIVLSRSLG